MLNVSRLWSFRCHRPQVATVDRYAGRTLPLRSPVKNSPAFARADRRKDRALRQRHGLHPFSRCARPRADRILSICGSISSRSRYRGVPGAQARGPSFERVAGFRFFVESYRLSERATTLVVRSHLAHQRRAGSFPTREKAWSKHAYRTGPNASTTKAVTPSTTRA